MLMTQSPRAMRPQQPQQFSAAQVEKAESRRLSGRAKLHKAPRYKRLGCRVF